MFSVIFEVRPRPDRRDEYLGMAAQLKPVVETIDGFIDNERFESRRRPGWLLSHSTWRDEKSVVRWRTVGDHHAAQHRGRREVLADYHLRVGDVTADSDGPVHEQRLDATEVGASTVVTLTEITLPASPRPAGADDLAPAFGLDPTASDVGEHDVFTSIHAAGKLALLISWADPEAGRRWAPTPLSPSGAVRHRVVRIVRDYGMFDRREAPQFFADAPQTR